ncbi:hypothetical protein [Hydrocoleum sp. CS-953]|nr:hypothetical protein [Hydrocoleum sp. CS-953]
MPSFPSDSQTEKLSGKNLFIYIYLSSHLPRDAVEKFAKTFSSFPKL